MHKILSCFTINLFKYFFCQHRVNCVVDSAVGLVKTAKLAIWIIKTHNFCTCVTYLTQEREEGGGQGYSGFQMTGMVEWVQKSKPEKFPEASNKTQKNPTGDLQKFLERTNDITR